MMSPLLKAVSKKMAAIVWVQHCRCILFGLKVPLTLGSVRTHYALICLRVRITRYFRPPIKEVLQEDSL